MYYKFANLRIEFCWGLGGDGDHVGATGSVGLRPSGRRVDDGMVLGWTAGGRPSQGEDTDPPGWAANLAKRRRRECISVMFKSTAEAVDKNGLRCDCLLCVFIYKLIVLVMRPRHCY